MKQVNGYHGEWNMGSPGGWDYQRITQVLGKKAWRLIREHVDPQVEVDFDHPQINAVPGFARMLLRTHERNHGKNPAHVVLLAEAETLDLVMENKNFVGYLNTIDGVNASLAGPGDIDLQSGKVRCRGREITVMFMDFNSDSLVKIGNTQDVQPIREAIHRGILVNPRGMEPLGVKSLFEALTGKLRDRLSPSTVEHTPWTRLFCSRRTTGPAGETIEDLPSWTKANWPRLILKPIHGYSGHGIFVQQLLQDPSECIEAALRAGDYIVQDKIPLAVWSEQSTGPSVEGNDLVLKEWQTDFRCFITDEGLQGFLARFGGIPTNVGSGGGGQPVAILESDLPYRVAVDRINQALFKLGYETYMQIQGEIERQALAMGFTYILGPIKILLRPRLLTHDHLAELRQYARELWKDAVLLEDLWRMGKLDDYVLVGERERDLALAQPWRGSPALMVSDGLFSFGANLVQEPGSGSVRG